ncbi:MAG: PTS sugar transporter subunit IIA [Phycisphaerales bacterium]
MDLIQPECVKVPLVSTEKREIIDELVGVLSEAGLVNDSKALADAVWSRECTRTTGIGLGLAIPHGKTASQERVVLAIGKPKEPVDFEALDGQMVKLVVLLASPVDKNSEHISTLAAISRMMTVPEFREQMYEAATSEQIIDLIRGQSAAV